MAERDLISIKLVAKGTGAASLEGTIGPNVDVRLFVLIAHDALRMAEEKGVTTEDLRQAKSTLFRQLADWGLSSSQLHLPSNGATRP